MHVVIVDGDVSYPATSGKRLRTLNLMLRLASQHRVTYIARNNGGSLNLRRAAEFLADHDIEPILVDEPIPVKSGPAFYARLALNLMSPLPYSAAMHDTPLMRRTIRRYAAEHEVDLWQFEWTPYLSALDGNARAKKLLIAHNVDSLIWQRYYQTERSWLKRWFIVQQWAKFEKYELLAFAKADRVVAVSPDDAELIHNYFLCPHVDVVENGIDRAYFESVEPKHDPNRILFLGALDWRPNLDAVLLLLDQVLPAVRAHEPHTWLDIVGRNPPAWLADRVTKEHGIVLHPDVPDVRPFLASSGVMAVPLRIGGGSRLKILEALAAGLPVVSTQVGAEGLRLDPGRHLTIVPDVEAIAPVLVDCIRQPARAQAEADAGRAFVLAEYDWDVLAGRLERVWETCVEEHEAFTAGKTP
jgi:glycosyltransferase involved in cell wall biosynthesis